jgi:hypothetical protein
MKVRHGLVGMVMSDEREDLSIDRDDANPKRETILDGHFWSQVRYVLQCTKPIYNTI